MGLEISRAAAPPPLECGPLSFSLLALVRRPFLRPSSGEDVFFRLSAFVLTVAAHNFHPHHIHVSATISTPSLSLYPRNASSHRPKPSLRPSSDVCRSPRHALLDRHQGGLYLLPRPLHRAFFDLTSPFPASIIRSCPCFAAIQILRNVFSPFPLFPSALWSSTQVRALFLRGLTSVISSLAAARKLS